jgi:hypothetical protein
MKSERPRDGTFLPEGVTMADIRRVHEELFVSEGIDLLSRLRVEESDKDQRGVTEMESRLLRQGEVAQLEPRYGRRAWLA